MYDVFRWKFLTGMVNVPNRLSVLYEYKSGTVNGLNSKYCYANSYVCKRLAITEYLAAALNLKCSLIRL